MGKITNKAEKKRLQFTLHPLFLLFAIYIACTGRLFLFLAYLLVAIVHELGHAIYAAKLGYKLNRLQLMPYGAVIGGDIDGISMKDEICLALAGPLTNFLCVVGFAGLWWFFPATYAYTELAFTASFTLCIMNILPAYSLDGGRVLYCILAKWKNRKLADIVLLITTILSVLTVVTFGIVHIVHSKKLTTGAISLFIFALFIVFAIFSKKNYRYERLQFDKSKAMRRGIEVKKIAVDSQTTVKAVVQFLEKNRLLEIEIFSDNELVALLNEEEFYQILQVANLYTPIGDYL